MCGSSTWPLGNPLVLRETPRCTFDYAFSPTPTQLRRFEGHPTPSNPAVSIGILRQVLLVVIRRKGWKSHEGPAFTESVGHCRSTISVGVEVEPPVDLHGAPSRWLADHAQPRTGFRSAAVASGIAREAGITTTSAIIALDRRVRSSVCNYRRMLLTITSTAPRSVPTTSVTDHSGRCNMRSNPT
jgi:hypothetical protein